MTVYVDDARVPYRRMIMCHMVADCEAELDFMAAQLGLSPAWKHRGHYNICQTKLNFASKSTESNKGNQRHD